MNVNRYEPTDVYRLYGGDLESGLELLYVGISYDARERFKQHRKRGFWSQVTYATVTRYKTRKAAEIVEAHAIRDEAPLFNIEAGSWSARMGNTAAAYRDEFIGYMECHIGRNDQQWAA